MKKYIAIFLLTVSCLTAFSQSVPSKYVGASASLYSGYGFAYRSMYNRIGFQINVAPYVSSDNMVVSAGVAGLVRLSDYERTNLYLNVGNHFFYSDDSYGSSNKQYLFGIGPSLQMSLSDNLFFELMLGYGGRYRLNYVVSTHDSPYYVSYTGGVSLLYKISKN